MEWRYIQAVQELTTQINLYSLDLIFCQGFTINTANDVFRQNAISGTYGYELQITNKPASSAVMHFEIWVLMTLHRNNIVVYWS